MSSYCVANCSCPWWELCLVAGEIWEWTVEAGGIFKTFGIQMTETVKRCKAFACVCIFGDDLLWSVVFFYIITCCHEMMWHVAMFLKLNNVHAMMMLLLLIIWLMLKICVGRLCDDVGRAIRYLFLWGPEASSRRLKASENLRKRRKRPRPAIAVRWRRRPWICYTSF